MGGENISQNKEKNIITISIVFLAILGLLYFFLAVYQPGAGMYVRATELPEQPDKYVEITLLELEKYPYIREAVSNPGKEVKLPFDHDESVTQFMQIMSSSGTQNLKVGDKFYEISIYSAD